MKCRPPGNRDPEPDEIAACAPYLQRQLEVLDPALVVTLGRFSLQTFMPGARIGQVHGTTRPVDPATGAREARAYAMYHPASAFRHVALRETIQSEMCAIPQVLIEARRSRAAAPADARDRMVDRPADPAPPPYQAPARLPVDEPPPSAPDRERVPIPIDDPLPADSPLSDPLPIPEPAPVPAGVVADDRREATSHDDQLSLFR